MVLGWIYLKFYFEIVKYYCVVKMYVDGECSIVNIFFNFVFN